MSAVRNHADEGLLLRCLDGELPPGKAREVRRHLEACWQCRTASEELEETVAQCVRYRKQVLEAYLPAPPAPWADLSRGFAEIDAEVGVESWWARLGRWLTPAPALRWSASVAAALLVAAGLYYHFQNTPSVQAANLLKRAVAAAQAHPAPARRIQVRTRTRKFPLSDRAANREVAAMFEAAHYSFADPLSARSYQEWRDQLPSRRDEVRTVADPVEPGQACYEIHTLAPLGELASASLMLRTTDLLPVAGRFEFRNREWVELSEFSDAPATESGTPAVTRLEAPARPAEPSRQAATPSGSSASISEELAVLAALHEIGADLGDPIEITRSGNRVLVSGIGLPVKRQEQIHQRLAGLPGVTVQFTDAPPAAQALPPDNPERAAAPEFPAPNRVQTRLERQLGGRVELERFSSQMLDWMEAGMARAYALRALAQRFPAGAEASMSARDRAILDDLAREHLKSLTAQMDSLHRTLAPVLVSLGGTTAQGRPVSQAAWQASAEDAFRAGRRVEVLLSVLLGVTPATTASQNLPSDLLTAMADLRASIAQCQQSIPRQQ